MTDQPKVLGHQPRVGIGPLGLTQPAAVYLTERYIEALLRRLQRVPYDTEACERVERALRHLRSLVPDGPPPPFCVGWGLR